MDFFQIPNEFIWKFATHVRQVTDVGQISTDVGESCAGGDRCGGELWGRLTRSLENNLSGR